MAPGAVGPITSDHSPIDSQRIKALWEARRAASTTIHASDVANLPLVRRHLLPRLVRVAGWTVPTLGLGFAVLTWYVSTREPAWIVASVALLAAAMLALLVYLGSIAYTSFAVRGTDEGLLVFEEHLLPRTLIRYPIPWTEFVGAALARPGGTDVNIRTRGLPVFLDEWQAMAILSDPRCPLFGKVPAGVADRIHLSA
jgi:hypothetical protein